MRSPARPPSPPRPRRLRRPPTRRCYPRRRRRALRWTPCRRPLPAPLPRRARARRTKKAPVVRACAWWASARPPSAWPWAWRPPPQLLRWRRLRVWPCRARGAAATRWHPPVPPPRPAHAPPVRAAWRAWPGRPPTARAQPWQIRSRPPPLPCPSLRRVPTGKATRAQKSSPHRPQADGAHWGRPSAMRRARRSPPSPPPPHRARRRSPSPPRAPTRAWRTWRAGRAHARQHLVPLSACARPGVGRKPAAGSRTRTRIQSPCRRARGRR
mmetsp:Transcript_17355/g.44441  ORF Transcript_17355/g.44441 Transcript_17355/m.44441 type:complete len:269 (-) Transcript_17355:789-1595(-)